MTFSIQYTDMLFLSLRTSIFYPLTLSMPPENILFGGQTLGTRWKKAINHHADLTDRWVEPTVIPDSSLIEAIKGLQKNQVLKQEDVVLGVHLDKELNAKFSQNQEINVLDEVDTVSYPGSCRKISSIQYLIDHNKDQIIEDWENDVNNNSLIRHPGYKNTFTDPGMDLQHVYIDDRQGPVVIHKGVQVLAGAKIMGPLVILPDSVVKMGAELYPGSTFGRRVVISGEIKNVIIHEYSSKAHAGYMGDSILGRWNNFGGGSITSNVVNTFSNAQVKDWNSGETVHLDTLKRGLITGDFVKLGVLSKTYQGTAIGSFSSIATNNAISGNIREFTWWTEKQRIKYEPDLLRKHCQRQMAQRQKTWTEEWENALSFLLEKNSPVKKQNIQ